jgi:large subunit ribosomal protein L2
VQSFDDITTSEPHKPFGRATQEHRRPQQPRRADSWWRGGGHKRRYGSIDFKRDKRDIPAKVSTIEYDPNRSARIALSPTPTARSATSCSRSAEGRRHDRRERRPRHPAGQRVPLKNIPLGTLLHNVELKPGKGGQIARSAGSSCSWSPRKATTRR